ncbi:hypothetical protein MMC07_008455 [Pseudocyphellaria aurata]|nr:hypothetical protein [Pseudocyphellaria aurata]
MNVVSAPATTTTTRTLLESLKTRYDLSSRAEAFNLSVTRSVGAVMGKQAWLRRDRPRALSTGVTHVNDLVHSTPHLPIANVIVLNGHPVSAQVTKAFDPGIFQRGDCFVRQGHQRICSMNKGEHMIQRLRKPVAKQCKKCMDPSRDATSARAWYTSWRVFSTQAWTRDVATPTRSHGARATAFCEEQSGPVSASAQGTKAFYPGIFQRGDCFVWQGDQRICRINNGEHMIQRLRKPVATWFKKCMDSVTPDPRGHGILRGESSQRRTGRGMLRR